MVDVVHIVDVGRSGEFGRSEAITEFEIVEVFRPGSNRRIGEVGPVGIFRGLRVAGVYPVFGRDLVADTRFGIEERIIARDVQGYVLVLRSSHLQAGGAVLHVRIDGQAFYRAVFGFQEYVAVVLVRMVIVVFLAFRRIGHVLGPNYVAVVVAFVAVVCPGQGGGDLLPIVGQVGGSPVEMIIKPFLIDQVAVFDLFVPDGDGAYLVSGHIGALFVALVIPAAESVVEGHSGLEIA